MSLLAKATTEDENNDKKKDPKEGTPTSAPGRRRAPATTTASVNLLSPWVLDELRVRRLRGRFVAGAVVLLVVIASIWGLLRFNLAGAEDELRADQSVGDGLMSQIGELRDVKVYVNNVRQRSISVERTMEHQIAFADVMRDLDEALPDGAALVTVNVLLPPDPATTEPGASVSDGASPLCPGPDPFGSRPVIGCVTITGTADSRADISELVQALGRSDLFIEPFITGTTSATSSDDGVGTIEFDGSLGLADTTYTGRFIDVDGSDDADTDADAQPAKNSKKVSR